MPPELTKLRLRLRRAPTRLPECKEIAFSVLIWAVRKMRERELLFPDMTLFKSEKIDNSTIMKLDDAFTINGMM